MADVHSLAEPTVLVVYSNRRDAETAKGHLEQQGVDSFLLADDAGGTHPQFQLTQGVKLLVRKSELESARQILTDINALPESKAKDEDEDDVGGTKTWRDLGIALLGIGIAIIILGFSMGNSGVSVGGLFFGLSGSISLWKSTNMTSDSA